MKKEKEHSQNKKRTKETLKNEDYSDETQFSEKLIRAVERELKVSKRSSFRRIVNSIIGR